MLCGIQSKFRDREPVLTALLVYSERFINANSKCNTIIIKEIKINKMQWAFEEGKILLSRDTKEDFYFHLK